MLYYCVVTSRQRRPAGIRKDTNMKKSMKINLIFAAVLLLLAFGILIWQLATAKPGMVARLTFGNNLMREISLQEDGIHDVFTGVYTVHLEVKDGAIRFTNSPCPDHNCEGFGWLRNEGDWAACLPAQAALEIQTQK